MLSFMFFRCPEYFIYSHVPTKIVPNDLCVMIDISQSVGALFDANLWFSEILCLEEFTHCRANGIVIIVGWLVSIIVFFLERIPLFHDFLHFDPI